MTVIIGARLPRECANCGTVMLHRHPEPPGGLTHYCVRCDEHVRVLFGRIPIRLKRCKCGRWMQKSQGHYRCDCVA